MSQATLKLSRVRKTSQVSADRSQPAESMLREIAFVLEMTRRAKEIRVSDRPVSTLSRM